VCGRATAVAEQSRRHTLLRKAVVPAAGGMFVHEATAQGREMRGTGRAARGGAERCSVRERFARDVFRIVVYVRGDASCHYPLRCCSIEFGHTN
jgi:hypothetical protein